MRVFALRLLLSLLLGGAVALAAQNSGSQQNPNDSSSQQQPPPQPPQQQPSPQQQPTPEKKKKDKKDKGSQDVMNAEVFSTAVANSVLNDLRDGLEGHTQRLMLSAFDADKMDGYLEFEDQIEAFFNKYIAFTVWFRIAQTSIDGPKGIVLVDIQLEENPRGAAPPVRKNGQMRFELERGKKGWKIVDFSPRNFFS